MVSRGPGSVCPRAARLLCAPRARTRHPRRSDWDRDGDPALRQRRDSYRPRPSPGARWRLQRRPAGWAHVPPCTTAKRRGGGRRARHHPPARAARAGSAPSRARRRGHGARRLARRGIAEAGRPRRRLGPGPRRAGPTRGGSAWATNRARPTSAPAARVRHTSTASIFTPTSGSPPTIARAWSSAAGLSCARPSPRIGSPSAPTGASS